MTLPQRPAMMGMPGGGTSRKTGSRVRRACDQCHISRTRCIGTDPCRRCSELGHVCQYMRSAKRRGRRPNALSSEAVEVATNASSGIQEGNDLDDSYQDEPTRFRPMASVLRPYSHESSHFSRDSIQQSRSPIQHHSGLHTAGNLEAAAPRELEQFNAESSVSPLRALDCNVPSEKSLLTEHGLNTRGLSSGHSYTILKPLLPLLANSVEPEVASTLLEYYFKVPGAKTHLTSASPYVLSHVLRRRSLLRATDPRSTSPALLVTLLWVSAQTADADIFLVPRRRQRVCKHLRNLAISLIYVSDQHSYHDREGGVMSCRSCLSDLGKLSSSHCDTEHLDKLFKFQNSLDQPRNKSLDDVLTFVLFTIIVSSGDSKADCHIWWTRALNASRMLRIGEEQYDKRGCKCNSSIETNGHICYSNLKDVERQEERRRVFWLLFCLDRHLGLSFNISLSIADSECQVYQPLRDHDWENLEVLSLHELHVQASFAPPTRVTGTGFFEFFLPLMTILGNVIDLHRIQEHPTFGSLHSHELVMLVEDKLASCAASIHNLADSSSTFMHNNSSDTPSSQILSRQDDMYDSSSRKTIEFQHLVKLVSVYSTFILHVLYVLLHGKWDALAMLDNHDDWIGSEGYMQCTSHAIEASEAISRLLESDPELSFMPYLLGIYLLQESFIILLFADRMPQVGQNESVKKACETIIRAHEVCVVTLNTEFQRRFRKVLRSTLCRVTGSYVPSEEEDRSKRKALMVYRWIPGGNGLGL